MAKLLKFPRRKKRKTVLTVGGLILGAAIGLVLPHLPPFQNIAQYSAATLPSPAPNFGLCFTGLGVNCVVDGDTFWLHGEKVRVADIDAPETHPPRCAREADLGNRATKRLQELLNGGPFELETVDRDRDTYGRKLRIVTRNGDSLGQSLVREGLARPWTGSRQPWC